MRAPLRFLLLSATSAALAAGAAGAGPAIAQAAAGSGFADAYYSRTATVPQARSPQGMRTYLSSNQPQMEMQSQLIFGNLVGAGGSFNSFVSMIQRQDGLIPHLPTLPVALSGVIANTGSGWWGGGIDGVPELTFPMSLTTDPWSARAEQVTLGKLPRFVDMRVVDGQLGQRGAIYEVTASLDEGSIGTKAPSAPKRPMTVYVRVKDLTGVAMWGFGPSGFKPQWLTAAQRTAIMQRFGGSIARYLRATDDPMTGQGNYYYSSPLLQVQRYVVVRGGRRVIGGTRGWLFFDQCTQSFGPNAEKILGDRFGWASFEIPMPALGGGMVLGQLSQPTVGTLPYAALATTRSPRARNGALIASNWGLKDITLTPARGSEWKSPATGKTYATKWQAILRGPDARHRGQLTLTAVRRDSEFTMAGRAVYEGLFRYSGTMAGHEVHGAAFAELQPQGSL